MLKFKASVRCPRSVIICAATFNAWLECGFAGECWVTSLNDSGHMQGSKHYTDEAADFRTRGLKTSDIERWAKVCKRRLGRSYDVVVESDHLHIEYDPKEG